MVKFKQKGDFSNITNFLERAKDTFHVGKLDEFAKEGVEALSEATPVKSGKTAASWSYNIKHTKNKVTISFSNSNMSEGVPIAIILQYGHGNGNGAYIEGVDYINPAIKPIFDKILNYAWKEVTKI